LYILAPEVVFVDPFFAEQEYKRGVSDFYGSEFQFNSSGILTGFYLYKV
jgi:hypothetical protein